MVDFELPYHSSKSVNPRDLREISIPLQDYLRVFLKQPVFVRGQEDEGIFLITGCEGNLPRLRDAISRKFKQKIHSSSITVIANDLRQRPEETATPPETPEEVINEREELAARSAAQQAYIDQIEQDKQGLIQTYEAQQDIIKQESEEKLVSVKTDLTRQVKGLETILTEQKKQNEILEDRNKSLLATLEGITKTRAGPNSVICSSLSEQSLMVKRLDRILTSTGVPIPDINKVGSMELQDYVNAELGTNLTFEQIGRLTEKPVAFEGTQEYANLFSKYDLAVKNKKLLDAFKSADEVPDAVKPYFAAINKERTEKDIKDFETAKAEHAKSIDLFDKIRDIADVWRNCNRAIDALKRASWTIPIFVTHYKESGAYKLEIVAPAGEPDGKVDGLLENVIQKTIGKLNPIVSKGVNGLNRYVVQLPANATASVAQFGTIEVLNEVYKQSELVHVAGLEIIELSRSYVDAKTAAVPAATQIV